METFICPYCQGEFVVPVAGRYYCPHCNTELTIGLDIIGQESWENRRQQNVVRSFFETWKMVMVSPVRFFRQTRPRANLMRTLYYGAFCQAVAFFIIWLYETGFSLLPSIYGWSAYFAGWGEMDFSGLLSWPVLPFYILVLLIVSPCLAVVAIFFTASIYHLCLMVLGAAKNGYAATLKAVSYGASAQLISVVPIVGQLVAAVWAIVLSIIGLKELHGSSYGRVIVAVLLPLFLCCGIIFMVGFALLSVAVTH